MVVGPDMHCNALPARLPLLASVSVPGNKIILARSQCAWG